MTFIYCHKDRRGQRWYYRESAGFRAHLPGSSSSFSREKFGAYQFATKAEAWEHCRKRRRRGSMHGTWIVITLRPTSDQRKGDAK